MARRLGFHLLLQHLLAQSVFAHSGIALDARQLWFIGH